MPAVKRQQEIIATLAREDTDHKAMVVKASDTAEKRARAQMLATRPLAVGEGDLNTTDRQIGHSLHHSFRL